MAAQYGNNAAEKPSQELQLDFCTLGMFILDDIHPPPTAADQSPSLNIIGGAGTYSAVGARLMSPPPLSRTVGWIVDVGTDFPTPAREFLDSWETTAVFRPRAALTTRGWNGYTANEHRAFRYLTEKKRLTADDLTTPPQSGEGIEGSLLASRCFHLICSPVRCVELCRRIQQRRAETFGENFPAPRIIWEPVPDLCIPSEKQNTLDALKYVDVISPNHEELGALFGFKHPESGDTDQRKVEEQARSLLMQGIGSTGEGAVVVRAGRVGCFVASVGQHKWLPAYYDDPNKVVDPTGGGNGFLGGFAVGLVRSHGQLIEATCWGSVAASFCIEQVGVPLLQPAEGVERPRETWNGEDVFERLEKYCKMATSAAEDTTLEDAARNWRNKYFESGDEMR